MESFILKLRVVKSLCDTLYSFVKLSLLLFLIYFSYNSYQKVIELKNSIVIVYDDIKTNYLNHLENEKQQFNKLYNTIEKQQEFINKQTNQQSISIDSSKLIMNIISDFILPSTVKKLFKK